MEREAPRRQPHQITDVVIWNLGPIELLKLQPQPDWTVFHGENGADKTTIVDAIESALAVRWVADLAAQGPAPRPLRPAQLRNGEPEGGVIIRTANGDSWQRTIGEHGNTTLRLADGAEAGRNASWARFGHGGIDPGRPTEPDLRAERVEALGAKGTPRHEAAIAALETVAGSRPAMHGSGQSASDAEEQLLTVFIGLAVRLEAAYPESKTPLADPAVCLFDDIDKHLHPGTQRRVVPMLHRTFPRTQFIGTTQSPVVLTTLHPRQITRLARNSGERVGHEPRT